MNDFLRKIASLSALPDYVILCAIDVGGLCPNVTHEEGLITIRKALDTRKDKQISTDSNSRVCSKNNIFEHAYSFFKQLRETAIGTKMAPPYIFMGFLKEEILSNNLLRPLLWWRYINDFFIWEHGEEELQKFLALNCYHPTVKFTLE